MTTEQARAELARRELARRQSSQPNIETQENNIGDMVASGAGVAGLGAIGYGVTKAWDVLAPVRTKVAGNLVNQLIKPKHKEYMFGKNPGMGIAKEGIWGNSLEDIGLKVDERLKELNTYSKEVRGLDEHKFKTVDLEGIFEPLNEALDEFKKAPKTHSAKINEINDILNDLKNNIPKDVNIKEVPTELAYQIKDVVKNLQKWTVDNPSDHIMNKGLKQTYHNIDNAIDQVLPLKEVNSRIANLISAKQAIQNQIEVISKRDPLIIGNLVNLATAPLRSAPIKTGVAKILSEKFAPLGKTVGKAGGKVMGVANILETLKYATDPQGYMLEQGGVSQEEIPLLRSGKRKLESGQGLTTQEESALRQYGFLT